MKRNIVIAAVAAAALVTGGTATAFAVAGDDDAPKGTVTATADRDDDRDDDGTGTATAEKDDDGRADDDGAVDDDVREAREALKGARVDAARAVAAAAEQGTVISVDLDDDDRVAAWEVEVLGKDGKERDLRVDLKTGKVTQDTGHADDDSDDDRDDRDGDDADD